MVRIFFVGELDRNLNFCKRNVGWVILLRMCDG